MAVLEKTEQELQVSTPPHQRLSAVIKQASETGTFWYRLVLRSPMGLVRVFYDHIQPILADEHEENDEFYTVMMDNWTVKTVPFINKKLTDKEDYDRRLRQASKDEARESVKNPLQNKSLFAFVSALAHDPAPASYPLLQALSLPLPRTILLALAHDPTSDQLLPSSPLPRPSGPPC
ncbi:hypothetical protein AYL99_09497 [Fonsecaea erecta]|uniref:Uncharacterized protein n=1 Tax=Fonsecaea erecta TaxID=1367422 RepID=A0A178Z951_9EURO|nr:hypothetical protein AYL99_09497 [Fonsecaea erecta]OAP56318.1 hypothetical protein AYL99_09497 [Fonsecaea erecta]